MTAPLPLPPGPAPRGPSGGRAFLAVAGLVARLTLSRARIAGLAAVAVIGVVAAALTTSSGTPLPTDLVSRIDGFVLRLFVPVTALLFATAALGDMVDDGSLVYLWMRPVKRGVTALAATVAPFLTALAIVAPTTVAYAVASGADASQAGIALAAAVVALVAYVPLFVAVGLRLRRALLWGLAYVLIWEAAVAPNSDALARLAVRTYSRSVLVDGLDAGVCPDTWPCLDVLTVPGSTAVVAAVVIGLVGGVWTWRRLRVQDVP